MNKVLFAGDLNVDIIMGGMESLPVVDKEIACESFDLEMGASTVLCACAYACLGGRASFCGLAGQDEYGDFMLRGLERFGLDTALVRRTSAVRTGVTVNLIYGSTRTQVTYPGTIAAFDGAGLDEAALRPFRHIHFGGVYLQHKFRPSIASLLSAAKAAGVTTSIDPQWDPAGRWEYMDEWLPLLTYLFVNQDEAMSITKAASPEEALHALAGSTHCPVVKTGKDGAAVLDRGKVVRLPSYPVDVVDTTGAGDCFDAGFLFARIEKQMSTPDAAAFANAVAARSCTFRGGVTARSTWDDVLRFQAERGRPVRS